MAMTPPTMDAEALAPLIASAMSQPYLRPEHAVYAWGAHAKRVADWLIESDWLAAVRDEAARDAWDEGHRLTAPHSDACEPTCPNPYRAAAHKCPCRVAPPTDDI